MSNPPDLVSVGEASASLGVSVRQTQRLIADGKIAAFKMPGKTGAYVITRRELDRFMAERAA